MRPVLLRQNPGFERKARGVRLNHHETIASRVTTRAGALSLLADQVAEEATLLEIVIALCAAPVLPARACGTTGSAISCECVCSSVAPGRFALILEQQDVAQAPVVLQIANAVAESPRRHLLDRFLAAVPSCSETWSGVSTTTSCAPMPCIRSKIPSPSRSSSPSMPSTGNLLGTTRSDQPGWFAPDLAGRPAPPAASCFRCRDKKGRSADGGAEQPSSRTKSDGRRARSVEMMTQRQ